MKKLTKSILVALMFFTTLAPVVEAQTVANTNIVENTTRKSYKKSSSSKSSSSMSSNTRSKNNSASNKAKNQAMNNNTTTKSSRSRGFGSFFGGLFLGGLLFGDAPIIGSIFNIIFFILIISLIIRLVRGRGTSTNQNRSQQNNKEYSSQDEQVYLFDKLDQVVEEANDLDMDVSYVLDNPNMLLKEKIKMIEDMIKRKKNNG